jgi:hypothetical protein
MEPELGTRTTIPGVATILEPCQPQSATSDSPADSSTLLSRKKQKEIGKDFSFMHRNYTYALFFWLFITYVTTITGPLLFPYAIPFLQVVTQPRHRLSAESLSLFFPHTELRGCMAHSYNQPVGDTANG